MPPLDLYTVRVMTLLTVLMSCLATLFAWRTNRTVAGMQWFAVGLLSMGVGSCLGMGASVLDGYALMVASSAFRLAGLMMVIQGLRLFRGFPTWSTIALAAYFGIVSAVFLWAVFWRDNSTLGTGVFSGGMGLLCADAAFSLFRRLSDADRLTHRATGSFFGFVSVFLLLRAVTDVSAPVRSGHVSWVPAEIGATIAADLAFIGCAFGMMLASNARLRLVAARSALFDALTGLPNRRFFEDRLLQAEQRTLLANGKLGVIYIDLDGFKLVNDTYGHDAGDELLRKISSAMSRVLRPDDCLARVGGDEFVVLVESIEHRARLEKVVERLSGAIAEVPAIGPGRFTRASYGAAIFPDDGASVQDVMREADAEMYHAKRRSRNAKAAQVAV